MGGARGTRASLGNAYKVSYSIIKTVQIRTELWVGER
jgi:hypothetical protein